MNDLLDDLEEIRRLTVRPGDTLVFRFKQLVPASRAAALVERIRVVLGRDDVKVLILDQGAALDVVELPEGEVADGR